MSIVRTKIPQKNKKPVTAILTADWHLRDSIPTCRNEKFFESQWEQVKKVYLLQKQYNCPVIHAGDLFHHWKSSPYLISLTMEYLPDQFYTIYGNHDLPYHNMDMSVKSALNVLWLSKKINILSCYHWGDKIENRPSWFLDHHSVYVAHTMLKLPDYPAHWLTEDSYLDLEDVFKLDFDLFLTGHFHRQFSIKRGHKLVVNPGCLTIQSFDLLKENFVPQVLLWHTEDNSVSVINLPEDSLSFSETEIFINPSKKYELSSIHLDEFLDKLKKLSESEGEVTSISSLVPQPEKLKPQVSKIIQTALEAARET